MSETKSTAKFNSQITTFGINPSKIYRNLPVEKLVEIAVEKNEGLVTSTGFVVSQNRKVYWQITR